MIWSVPFYVTNGHKGLMNFLAGFLALFNEWLKLEFRSRYFKVLKHLAYQRRHQAELA